MTVTGEKKLVPVSAYYKVERGDEWGMAFNVYVPASASDEDILKAAHDELYRYAKDNYFVIERLFELNIDGRLPSSR